MFRTRKGQTHAQADAERHAPAYAPAPEPVMSPWARRALDAQAAQDRTPLYGTGSGAAAYRSVKSDR